eukprot:682165-Amphidinium_carterae.1
MHHDAAWPQPKVVGVASQQPYSSDTHSHKVVPIAVPIAPDSAMPNETELEADGDADNLDIAEADLPGKPNVRGDE